MMNKFDELGSKKEGTIQHKCTTSVVKDNNLNNNKKRKVKGQKKSDARKLPSIKELT